MTIARAKLSFQRVLFLLGGLALVAATMASAAAPPSLRGQGAATQLVVEGRPFIMLAGELHNSTASNLDYLKAAWEKLATLNLNTVLATVSWELLEPEEGRFDFALVDGLLDEARRHNHKLVLLWFGSWKNGVSSYAPAWVKKDTQRFPRAEGRSHHNKKDVLSPFSEASCAADARAFAALMRHLRDADGRRQTVVMVQVENEAGLKPETRDLCAAGDAAFRAAVPGELIAWFKQHREELHPWLKETWAAAGNKEGGAWSGVFGDGAAADEIFMAWHYARYIGRVAAAGKAAYPLPMFVNAWLEGDGAPGTYPTGGPVAKVMDIWRAAAPALDVFSLDIYLADFKGLCAAYARAGNPLFIPEVRRDELLAGRAFWAFGEHGALGLSPFGIESLDATNPLVETYGLLSQLAPMIAQAQGTGKMMGVYQQPGEVGEGREADIGDWRAHVRYEKRQRDRRAMGLVIQIAPDEYLVAGNGFSVTFSPRTQGPRYGGILQVEEGRFAHGRWMAGRRLNGDETGANWQAKLPPFDGNTFSQPDKLRILRVKLYRYD